MYIGILDQAGATLFHRHRPATPEALLKASAPTHAQIVLAAACRFPWYWLAARGAAHGSPCGLGPALSMQASPGGKAQHDQLDSPTLAALLRGGRLPQASGSPAQRRATRALLRRRRPLAHQRAELLAHVQQPPRQYTLPALGTKLAAKATRDGGAARCAAPAVPKSIAGALALLPSDDALLGDGARPIVHPAKPQDAHTLYRLQTGPGIGTMRGLGLLDARHALHRFPRGPDCVSSGRLGPCAQASAGPRWGPAGAPRGQAHRTGALADAAVLGRRDQPAAPTSLAPLENKHAPGHALTGLAQPLARAV